MDGDRQREVLMVGRWWWVPWDMASPGTSQLTVVSPWPDQRSLMVRGPGEPVFVSLGSLRKLA